jgi:hypothetical protein
MFKIRLQPLECNVSACYENRSGYRQGNVIRCCEIQSDCEVLKVLAPDKLLVNVQCSVKSKRNLSCKIVFVHMGLILMV